MKIPGFASKVPPIVDVAGADSGSRVMRFIRSAPKLAAVTAVVVGGAALIVNRIRKHREHDQALQDAAEDAAARELPQAAVVGGPADGRGATEWRDRMSGKGQAVVANPAQSVMPEEAVQNLGTVR